MKAYRGHAVHYQRARVIRGTQTKHAKSKLNEAQHTGSRSPWPLSYWVHTLERVNHHRQQKADR